MSNPFKKPEVSIAVLEAESRGLSARVGDMAIILHKLDTKMDKVLVMESQLATHAEKLESHTELLHESATNINGVGSRVNVIEAAVMGDNHPAKISGRVTVIENTIETHKRNFRIIASLIVGTFVAGMGLMGWLAQQLYSGIIDAIRIAGGP